MLAKLFLLFVAVPLIELAILIQIGSWLGFWPTIGLVLLTGAAGAMLARSQGTRVLGDIRQELAAGHPPTSHLIDGLMVLVGGLVLLTPGILTDLLGLALLMPGSRAILKRQIRRRLEGMANSGQIQVVTRLR